MTKGERIKKLRLEKEMSQTELAERVDQSKQTIYKYENNIVTNIPSDVIEKIAIALDTTLPYLFGWEDNSTYRKNESSIVLTPKEEKLVLAYREHPEHQSTIDKILDISDDESDEILIAARNGGKPKNIKMKKRKGVSIHDKPDYDGGRK